MLVAFTSDEDLRNMVVVDWDKESFFVERMCYWNMGFAGVEGNLRLGMLMTFSSLHSYNVL